MEIHLSGKADAVADAVNDHVSGSESARLRR
jgi:hypothetical protein